MGWALIPVISWPIKETSDEPQGSKCQNQGGKTGRAWGGGGLWYGVLRFDGVEE